MSLSLWCYPTLLLTCRSSSFRIVVNAADNKQRDANMSELRISIDKEKNRVSVKNNGQGIPVEVHKEHKCYVPSLIFGELLTGSNFDDNEAKTTGKFRFGQTHMLRWYAYFLDQNKFDLT